MNSVPSFESFLSRMCSVVGRRSHLQVSNTTSVVFSLFGILQSTRPFTVPSLLCPGSSHYRPIEAFIHSQYPARRKITPFAQIYSTGYRNTSTRHRVEKRRDSAIKAPGKRQKPSTAIQEGIGMPDEVHCPCCRSRTYSVTSVPLTW